eukprot:CAMPEP_0198218136 /NCGR_PEP_ID=MMETSP1445-20131203/67582_1 /TAXON_ID=36898 /ORGANISM="Pyramimonas sp., Strain CCMP2087" /LENGTH=113 /DNA_ID=CAMNT_0043895045 /DNA_START=94 /DNA_END=432 /DNA_ORIENTATION=-
MCDHQEMSEPPRKFRPRHVRSDQEMSDQENEEMSDEETVERHLELNGATCRGFSYRLYDFEGCTDVAKSNTQNMQGTFRDLSGNFQATSRKRSGNIATFCKAHGDGRRCQRIG